MWNINNAPLGIRVGSSIFCVFSPRLSATIILFSTSFIREYMKTSPSDENCFEVACKPKMGNVAAKR